MDSSGSVAQKSLAQLLSEQTMAAPLLIQWLLERLSLADLVFGEFVSPSPMSCGKGVLTIMMKFVECPVVSRVPYLADVLYKGQS